MQADERATAAGARIRPAGGMWANLAMRIVESGPGRVVVEALPNAGAHGFPTGRGDIVHGGAVAAIADAALASAAATLAGEHEACATADLRVEYFRMCRPGRVTAQAEVRHRARRLAFCQVTLVQDGGVIGEGRASVAYVPR